MLPKIRDAAGQKGTGKWTAIAALNYGVPVTLIGEAVFSRCLSALKSEREIASKYLPRPTAKFSGDKKKFLEDVRQVCILIHRVHHNIFFQIRNLSNIFIAMDKSAI